MRKRKADAGQVDAIPVRKSLRWGADGEEHNQPFDKQVVPQLNKGKGRALGDNSKLVSILFDLVQM